MPQSRAHHLALLAVSVAGAECKQVVRRFLKALRREVGREVEKNCMPWASTKDMAGHADTFPEQLVAEFTGISVTGSFFHIANKFRDKAPMLGHFYQHMITAVRRLHELPSTIVHEEIKRDMLGASSTTRVPEPFSRAFEKKYVGISWCVATLPAGYPAKNKHRRESTLV